MKTLLGEIYDGEGKPVFSATREFVARRLLPVLAKGAVAGVVVGAIVTLFNYLLEVAGEFARVMSCLWSASPCLCIISRAFSPRAGEAVFRALKPPPAAK